jgi:hypothetical protein
VVTAPSAAMVTTTRVANALPDMRFSLGLRRVWFSQIECKRLQDTP